MCAPAGGSSDLTTRHGSQLTAHKISNSSVAVPNRHSPLSLPAGATTDEARAAAGAAGVRGKVRTTVYSTHPVMVFPVFHNTTRRRPLRPREVEWPLSASHAPSPTPHSRSRPGRHVLFLLKGGLRARDRSLTCGPSQQSVLCPLFLTPTATPRASSIHNNQHHTTVV